VTDVVSPLKEHQRVDRNTEGDIIRTIHPVSYEESGEDGNGTRYVYCGNNPVVYYDPSGYMDEQSIICGNLGKIGEGKGEENNDSGSINIKGQEELNHRTPAQKYADEVRNLPSSERPNVVAVIEIPDGQNIKSHNAQGIYSDEVQAVLDLLGNENDFGRQCAEVNAVSIARNNNINLQGATISVANVRGPNSTSGVHGTPKTPCNVCQPMLDFYGVEYRE